MTATLVRATVLAPVLVAAAVVALGGAARSRAEPARPAHSTPDAGDVARHRRLLRRGLPVAAAAGGVALLAGPIGLAICGIAIAAAPLARRRANARRNQRAIDHQLPDAIELLVLLVHAGRTPRQAIEDIVPHAPPAVRPAFVEVHHRCLRGRPLADALRALPEGLGPGATLVADAIGAADRYGLPLGPVLDQLATDARQIRRRLAEGRARTLPVRLSFPLVVCTLPAFVLLAIVPAVLAAVSSLDTSW